MKKISTIIFPCFVTLFYLLLYVPIFVLILFSFNNNAITYNWLGFTAQWYMDLFESVEVWEVLGNSLFVACTSVCLSLLFGLGVLFFGSPAVLNRFLFLFYGCLAIPEIVLAVGLLSVFSFFAVPLGASTLIAGHTLLGLGYVVPILHARYAEMDTSLLEASYDLGATKQQTFLSIILPLLAPAMVAAGLLVFIISLDDFLISFFCAGASMQTLPLYIFAVIRSGASPMVNALSTFLLLISMCCVLLFSFLQVQKGRIYK
jgi:spermidine/putrescine transport system permease protein